MVLLEDEEEPEEATNVAVWIEEALRVPFWVGGHNLFVTTSVEVGFGGADGERAGETSCATRTSRCTGRRRAAARTATPSSSRA